MNDITPIRGSDAPIEGKCGAKLKRTDPPRYCKRNKAKGRTRCKIHGGASLRGIESGTFKHGRYSKALPGGLADKYAERLADPDILSMVPDIALLDARLEELLETSNVNLSAWDDLRELLEAMTTAVRAGDMDRARSAVTALTDAVEAGAHEASKWRDVVGLVKERRSIVDTERKLQYDEANAIKMDAMLVLQQATLAIIHRHVMDPATRAAITADFHRVEAGGRRG